MLFLTLLACPLPSSCVPSSLSPTTDDGIYCPEGSFKAQLCPKGQYCPSRNGTQIFDCPPESFCPEYIDKPIDCPFGSECPANSSKPGQAVVSLGILSAVLVPATMFGFFWILWTKRKEAIFQAKKAHDRASSSKKRTREQELMSGYIKSIRISLIESKHIWDEQSIAAHRLSIQTKSLQKTVERQESVALSPEAGFVVYRPPKCMLDIDFENLRLWVNSKKSGPVTVVDGIPAYRYYL
jgi:hypothetical protein